MAALGSEILDRSARAYLNLTAQPRASLPSLPSLPQCSTTGRQRHPHRMMSTMGGGGGGGGGGTGPRQFCLQAAMHFWNAAGGLGLARHRSRQASSDPPGHRGVGGSAVSPKVKATANTVLNKVRRIPFWGTKLPTCTSGADVNNKSKNKKKTTRPDQRQPRRWAGASPA